MVKRTYLMAMLIGIFSVPILAQDHFYNGDPDASFLAARTLAFNGERSIARDTLKHILTKYPNYSDVRTLLASTYSWDGNYNEARGHFNKITSKDRQNKETWVAAIKNEMYAKEYYIALGLSNKAMHYLKEDQDLIALKKEILIQIKKASEVVLKNDEDEANKEAKKEKVFKNSIGISNRYDVFDVAYDPMVYSSLEFKRETKMGSIIPRINYSNRFQINGLQYELDAYPKFSKTFYAYTNYAFSNAPTFPNHRVGGELYANLPKSLEVSIGMRYLDFKSTQVNIFTGSVGMYRGNYYVSLRPYITPSKVKPISLSGTLVGRRYLKDAENYLGFLAGYGFSSDLRQLRDGDEVLAETLLFVESQHLLLEYQFTSKSQPHLYKANLGVLRQELAFDSGNYYWSVSAGFTYHIKF